MVLKRVGTLRKLFDYATVFSHQYDAVSEAETLLKDEKVRSTGATLDDVATRLSDVRASEDKLVNLAKLV